MDVICAGCGESNRDEARFCRSCGETMAARCADCDAELPRDSRFCDACGTPVSAAASGSAPTTSPVRASESRKVVTVLFADLAGSTSLQERMDAESVRRVMDRFYDVMRAAVAAHGGTVVKFMGDGMMAAFGVPTVAEDDAVRAVRAAVAMQDAFVAVAGEVRRDWDAAVALRVGVNTGEVVVAEGEDDVVGDAVNVAARLEHEAGESGVLVGQATWRLTRHLFTFEEVPALELKGKAEPVPAFRLVSLDQPQAEGTSPFVGRENELARIVAAFDAAVAERCARLVTVVGSPGLGKSRLVREAARRLADGATVVESQCDPAGGSTLAPVADVLRQAVGVGDGASPGEITEALRGVFVEGDDTERIVAAGGTVLGAQGAASPQETFWAVRRILEQVAAVRPAVVVFDDVHWAEPLLLDLIEHLAEWTRDAPVLIVALARPEIREVRPALAETGGPAADVVVLEALPDEEGIRLASGLLEGRPLDETVAARLLGSAEGNPLFLRELVKMLLEDGALRLEGDVWVASEGFDLDAPPTIHALLSARIERLAPDERTVVEGASVVGHQFFRGAVAMLAPPPVAARVDSHLESLRRKEVVEPEGTYWIDEPVFRFHHGLIRDAAYRRLLKEARADLHERVAGWLVHKAGDFAADHEEVVGYHLEQAYWYRRDLGASDAVAGELGRRAAGHLATAGRRFLERDDLRSASGLLGRALACLPGDDPSRAELLADRCEALLGLGEVTEGAKAVGELSESTNADPRLVAWAECFSAQVASFAEPEALPEWVERAAGAADRLEELGDAVGTAKAASVHGAILARLGQVAACEAALDRALGAARAVGDRRRANAVLAGAPLAALWGPSPVTRAAGRCLDVVRVLRITTDSPLVEAVALRAQAVLESFRGRFDAARRLVAASRRTLEELGLRHGLLHTDLFEGLVELVADDAASAEPPLRRAYEGFRSLGAGVDAAQAAALLGRACLAQGRDDEALALTEESERLGGQDLKTAISWRAVRAEALARRGETGEALRLAHEAVDLAAPTDALVDHADARVALAAVLEASGDAERSAAERRRAAELYLAKGATALAGKLGVALEVDPDDHDGGFAPHETLTGEREEPATLDNLAVRTWERGRRATQERDLDGLLALMADDVVFEERRRAFGEYSVAGKAEVADLYRLVFTGPVTFDDVEVLAVRGDHFVLTGATLRWQDHLGSETEHPHLRLDEIDDTGLIVRAVLFEPDAMVDAVRELDRRHGERDPSMLPGLELSNATMRTYAEGDWDAYRALLAPDFVAVDRRRAGWGELPAADYVARLRALKEMAPDIVLWMAAIDGQERDVSLTRHVARGTTPEGGRFEVAWRSIGVRHGGRLQRYELFDPDDRAGAEARFRELVRAQEAAEGGDEPARGAWPPIPANVAVETYRKVRETLLAGDLDACVALCAEDHVYDERRLPPAQFRVEGREALRQALEAVVTPPPVEIHCECLAVRGDRLALSSNRFVWVGPSGRSVEHHDLRLDDVDEAGRLAHTVLFEPGHLAEAVEEMDSRYLAEVDDECRVMVSTLVAAQRAVDARDWDALRATLADGFRLVDRRLVGYGERDADGYVAGIMSMFDMAPEVASWTTHIVRLHPRVSLVASRHQGVDSDGALFEGAVESVGVLGEGGFELTELFDPSQREQALARFEELAGGELSNLATEAWSRVRQGLLAGDVDAALAPVREDVVHEERKRAPARLTVEGREALRAMLEQVFARPGGHQRIDTIVVATRGDCLALTDNHFHWADGVGDISDYRQLRIDETDAQGRISASVVYDPEDIDAALAELDARWRAS